MSVGSVDRLEGEIAWQQRRFAMTGDSLGALESQRVLEIVVGVLNYAKKLEDRIAMLERVTGSGNVP